VKAARQKSDSGAEKAEKSGQNPEIVSQFG
jgi:hypothetical protein